MSDVNDDWFLATLGVDPRTVAADHPATVGGMVQAALQAIAVPQVGSPDGAALAGQMRVLDSMRPSPGDPDQYAAVQDGQDVLIAKAAGDALRAQVAKQLLATLDNIQAWKAGIRSAYAKAQPESLGDFVAARTLTVFGGVKDPGDQLTRLMDDAFGAATRARADLGRFQFTKAAGEIAASEALGAQAEHLVTVWASKTQSAGATTITVLQHTKKASFAVAKTIATAEFGPAGAAAIDALETGSEVTGEALAGHEINWAEKVIDLGMKLLLDKFGKQAEAAVKGKVARHIAARLAGRMAKDKAEKLAETIAAKLAAKLVSKGSDFVKQQLTKLAAQHKGQAMTWDALMQATVASLGQPDGNEAARLEAEADQALASMLR